MKIYEGFPFQVKHKDRAIALGFFDGVHLGHQQLLQKLICCSQQQKLVPTVFTFDLHPEIAFDREISFPGLLQTNQMRLQKLAGFGVEEVILSPLTKEVGRISAEDFYFEYLIRQFGMKALIVGEDARFGYRVEGDVDKLRAWSRQCDQELYVVPDLEVAGQKVSSTRIRRLLEAGEVKQANSLLGYAHQISGIVKKGKKLGRTLGFPTINLDYDADLVTLKFGVYASNVVLAGVRYPAITSIGTNPTVDSDSKIKVETYIYHADMDLYHLEVLIELLDFIRPELLFDNVLTMREQILRDLENVEEWHNRSRF